MEPKGYLIEVTILSTAKALEVTNFVAVQNTVLITTPPKYGILRLKNVKIKPNTSYNE